LQTNKIFLFDATIIPHEIILLFTTNNMKYIKKQNRVVIDEWISIELTELTFVLFKSVREGIDDLLKKKVENKIDGVDEKLKILQNILNILI
jgi:hypothetical protein